MKDIKTPEELLDFMKDNINYGYLGRNGRIYIYGDPKFQSDWYKQCILESKDDILKTHHGTCWDQVEFERAWFESKGYEVKTLYQMVCLNYNNSYPTHSFLAFKENDKWCWFEHSFRVNLGIHRFDTFDELIKYEYSKYLESLMEHNITKKEIEHIVITEFPKPKERISTQEYIDHCINSKLIYSYNKENTENSLDER